MRMRRTPPRLFPPCTQSNGSEQRFPTAESYDHILLLDKENVTRTLALCASQWGEGSWTLAVYNPRMSPLGFNLTVRKEGRCLNDCSGEFFCGAWGQGKVAAAAAARW